MKNLWKIILTASLLLTLSSCQGRIRGYGILLWNESEHNLDDSQMLPVYLKSNISKVYVVQDPSTKEKIEIPLWKMTEPLSKGKAKKELKRYGEYKHTYALVAVDGLPIRAEHTNQAKQIYRLRQGEIIRVLYSGEGEAVTTGGKALEGDWLKVLTDDGNSGWCFSYNLRLFEKFADGTLGEGAEIFAEAVEESSDATLEDILAQRWYPEYYQTMIDNKQIDLNYMEPSFGLDTGADTGLITFHMNGVDAEYEYNGVTKLAKNVYKFNDTQLQFTIRASDSISVQYTDEYGMPTSYTMVTFFGSDIADVITQERQRRSNLLSSLRSLGPTFSSSTYGTLTLRSDSSFTWSDWSLLAGSIIPSYAGNSGTVEFKYFLPDNLKGQWNGIITLVFNGTDGKEVNFLYKREANGVRLSNVNVLVTQFSQAKLPSINISHPSNAIVIFMQR